jgi:hypothetical protein
MQRRKISLLSPKIWNSEHRFSTHSGLRIRALGMWIQVHKICFCPEEGNVIPDPHFHCEARMIISQRGIHYKLSNTLQRTLFTLWSLEILHGKMKDTKKKWAEMEYKVWEHLKSLCCNAASMPPLPLENDPTSNITIIYSYTFPM